jgi:DNA invertase Pin-like site-specific DNA recombinase
MTIFRWAAWAAVSSDEQAGDHVSISRQVEACRTYATSIGGEETAGPFIAEGYSRSFYENLSDAMNDIPALKEAVTAADRNQFDVLFVYYFDRLRTLAYPVFIHLGKARKQLRSVSEITPILPPEMYDFAKDTITATMIHLHGIKNDAQISRLITQKREAMPKRVASGLNPGRVPYGYRYTNSRTPHEQDPARIARLIQARDMLLRGEALEKIAEHLGVNRRSVARILSNPFYVGTIAYNKTYVQRLGTKRIAIHQPRSKWTTGEGRHEPIWDEEMREAIVAELARRGPGEVTPFLYNKLLRCAVCGQRVRRHMFSSGEHARWVITCRFGYSSHVVYEMDDFLALAASEIQKEMSKEYTGEADREEADQSELLRRGLVELQKQRERIQDGFKAGIYTAQEAGKELRANESESTRIQADLERLASERVTRRQAAELMNAVDFDDIPAWLAEDDPLEVNRLLGLWMKEIVVGPDGLKIVKR